MPKLTLQDLDLKGKRVLVRADFNVPLDADLKITDDTRIRATLPTLKYILHNGAKKLIIMSHLGRPDGKAAAKYSLAPVAKRLQELMGEPVLFVDDCVGAGIKEQIAACAQKIVLLENLRFHPEEEENDSAFAKKLASLADIFVNDAFGTCHRAHASTEGIAKYLPSVSGFLVKKEIEYFEKATKNPAKPYVAILGGAKVSDKIGVITNLMNKVDAILIGGAMAYTFLKSEGIDIGKSKLEADKVDLAKEILKNAEAMHVRILLPVDHVVADKVDAGAKTEVVNGEAIPDGKIGLDIGPRTVTEFEKVLKDAKTVVWNGPVGFFEIKPFSKGTEELAKFLTRTKATTIIGGGDTAAAIYELGLEDKMSHISTGGGASLEYLEGKTLPGIAALNDK